jgi:hypothetical protein
MRVSLRVSLRVSVFTAAFCATAYVSGAAANTIHVCSTCAHTSIQAAVTDAASGDTVDIAVGRYVENVTIAGKALTLTGQGAGSTFVYAAGRGPVFTLGSAVPSDLALLVTIRGVTISHGNHTGGTGVGGGVQVRAGAYLHLENSTVTENIATQGAGIAVDSPSAPVTTLIASLIDSNSTFNSRGGGGGVFIGTGSKASIQQSIITRNTSEYGGGVYAGEGSSLSVTGSTINGNHVLGRTTQTGLAGGTGGGIEAHGTLALENSYLMNNYAQGENGGGGLALFSPATENTVVANTVIAQNTGYIAGILGDGGNLTLRASYVVQNQGIGIWGNFTLVNQGSTVKDNTGGNICLNNVCTR